MLKAALFILALLALPAHGEPEDLAALLEPLRAKAEAPALAAIVIRDGKVQAIGAVGLRKHGEKASVTIHDKWHIGSNTKSMTATLAATFVEEGKLTWDTTISDILGNKLKMRDEYKAVSLRDLLAHRSGIPGQVPATITTQTWKDDGRGNIRTRRLEFVEAMLDTPPSSKPGTAYEYSNAGYITAGAMLEVLSGKDWETLMEERLFKPLTMASAGFGMPAGKGRTDQPWGHDDKTTPHPRGLGDDNPIVYGPAGTVHLSLSDLANYVQMHLARKSGPVLKKTESFDTLHRNVGDNKDYALGWNVASRGWAGGPTLNHSGSNTMNYCSIWAAPKKNFALITVTNFGGKEAATLCDETAGALIGKYAK